MKIGLTYTGSDEKHNNYARWLKEGEEGRPDQLSPGEKIEVIKLSAEDDNLSMMDECDALVLSGGVDIHPSFYGGGEDYSAGISKEPVKWKKERDQFEIAALERAWQQKKPVLGVCRGMQLINVVRGGTLVQDLDEKDKTHQYQKKDMQHGVEVVQGSLLHGITGVGGRVNSAHHQAIDQLGEGLRVNCRAEDGTIEGVEWADPADKPFMLAVQWHPERMFINGFRDRELYLNIRNRFIEEIKKTTAQ
jgi:putative glutamine amidotransferase